MDKMRVAIVIGHHKKSKGAYSEYFKMHEWDFYNLVSKHIENVDVFYHDENISGYITRVKDTAKRLNEGNYHLVMELHFNSFFEPQANGCETLYYYKNKKGKLWAEMFSDLVRARTGLKNRGVKALANRNDRGFASVYYPNATTLLIEPFFGSNKRDCENISSIERMANIINEFLNYIK